MEAGIYALFCKHWTYIGGSKDVEKRLLQHFYCPSNHRIKTHKANGCPIKGKVILRCNVGELNELEEFCISKIPLERLANVQKRVATKRHQNRVPRPKFVPLLVIRKKR